MSYEIISPFNEYLRVKSQQEDMQACLHGTGSLAYGYLDGAITEHAATLKALAQEPDLTTEVLESGTHLVTLIDHFENTTTQNVPQRDAKLNDLRPLLQRVAH